MANKFESLIYGVDRERTKVQPADFNVPMRIPSEAAFPDKPDCLVFASLQATYHGRKNFLIIDRYQSLPLSTRSVEEIWADKEIEEAFQASQNRSQSRRRSSRINSQFVVGLLDDLVDVSDDIKEKVAANALSALHFASENNILDYQAD